MPWENPLQDQLRAWLNKQQAQEAPHPSENQDPPQAMPPEEETLIDVVRFTGLPNGVHHDDFNGSFLSNGPAFEYASKPETTAFLQKAHGSLPLGLVQVLYGSCVDVTDPYPNFLQDIPKNEFASPPDPDRMRGNPCGVKRVDYMLLFLLSQKEHPGVLCRFLISGTPLDYQFWFSRKVRKGQRVDFAYRGDAYSFRTVPAVQVGLQGLIDIVVDPGHLLHGLYQLNVAQVGLLKEALDNDVANKSKTPQQARALLAQEEGMRRALEADLLTYAKEPLPLFIVHKKPDNVYVAKHPTPR